MALTQSERRSAPRVEINGTMNYRQPDSKDFRPGKIENISAGGALIWIGKDLPLDDELIIQLVPDGPDETLTDLVATLLYKLPEQEDSLYGYGCSINLL